MSAKTPTKYVPKLQPDAFVDQAAPVQNTWYPWSIAGVDLGTKKNVVVYAVLPQVQTANETLEVRLYCDDLPVKTGAGSCTAGTAYYVYLASSTGGDPIIGSSRGTLGLQYTPIWLRKFSCGIRKTTATGAGNLQLRVIYGKW